MISLPSTFPTLAVEDITRDIHRFCEIGNRFVGTSGEAQARELIESEFRSAGLDDVRLEELPIVVYGIEEARCGVAALSLEYPTTGLQFTAEAAQREAPSFSVPQVASRRCAKRRSCRLVRTTRNHPDLLAVRHVSLSGRTRRHRTNRD